MGVNVKSEDLVIDGARGRKSDLEVSRATILAVPHLKDTDVQGISLDKETIFQLNGVQKLYSVGADGAYVEREQRKEGPVEMGQLLAREFFKNLLGQQDEDIIGSLNRGKLLRIDPSIWKNFQVDFGYRTMGGEGTAFVADPIRSERLYPGERTRLQFSGYRHFTSDYWYVQNNTVTKYLGSSYNVDRYNEGNMRTVWAIKMWDSLVTELKKGLITSLNDKIVLLQELVPGSVVSREEEEKTIRHVFNTDTLTSFASVSTIAGLLNRNASMVFNFSNRLPVSVGFHRYSRYTTDRHIFVPRSNIDEAKIILPEEDRFFS